MSLRCRYVTCSMYAVVKGFRNNKAVNEPKFKIMAWLSTIEVSFDPVSYTHLDVYKRQTIDTLE